MMAWPSLCVLLCALSASNAVLVLYSHGIGETAEGVSMSRSDLGTILAEAERLGMAVLGFDELDRLGGASAASPVEDQP